MTNSADPDQLAYSESTSDLDLHCLQRQGISGFSRTRVKIIFIYRSEVPMSPPLIIPASPTDIEPTGLSFAGIQYKLINVVQIFVLGPLFASLNNI